MLPNTTSERAKLVEWEVVQQWKVYAEALTQRVTKCDEALRKYDFKSENSSRSISIPLFMFD
jgi:hypothetical protein